MTSLKPSLNKDQKGSPLRVLVLCHIDLVPPSSIPVKKAKRSSCEWITEHDVLTTLRSCGYEVEVYGVWKSPAEIELVVKRFKPDLVFNLMEEFNGETKNEHSACGLLEMLDVNFTGSSSKNLLICRDKILVKTVLKQHGIPTPDHQKTIGKNSKIKFPVIVKCQNLEASSGISKSSVVKTEKALLSRVKWLGDKFATATFFEEFIEGKDVFIGVLINQNKLEFLEPWELRFKNSDKPSLEVYGSKEKWSEYTRRKKGISTGPFKGDQKTLDYLKLYAKQAIAALSLDGYLRIDFRVPKNGKPFLLEINPNPGIAKDDEFALSAKYIGISYQQLLNKIMIAANSTTSKKLNKLVPIKKNKCS